jgi:PAS domain S-box-containing protein
MCFALNLSEQKRAEDALEQVRDQLEIRLQEQTAELIQMNEELKDESGEHKQAEEALRLSEQRFRYLAEYIDEVFWFTQVNPERTLYVSPSFETIWGRPVKDLYENPRLWLQCIYPEDQQRVTEAFEAWLAGRTQAYDMEYRILNSSNEVRWIHDRGVKEVKEGRPVLIGGIATDITERKRVQETLRDSEARLNLAQQAAGAGVWDWDIRSGRMNWSEEYYRLLGLKPDERQPSHENWLLSVHPDDRTRVQGSVEAELKEKRELAMEFRITRPDGEVRWLIRRGRTFTDHDGQPVRMLGITMDITDRKRAELLLAGEKRLFEMMAKGDSLALVLDALCRVVEELFSGLLASILLLDPNGNRLWHGGAPSLPRGYIDAINGVSIGPAVGSCGTAAYRAEQVIVSDIATDPLWADYRDLGLAHGLRACWSTPILSSEDGVLGTFATYYREPRRPSSQEFDVVEWATRLAEVTIERKRTEEALSARQSELTRVSRALTMGELVSSIAHEINQPLAAVVTNADTCLRWLTQDKPDLKELRDAVQDIVTDANRASNVIARTRELLKKGPPQTVRLDMNHVIREVVVLVNKDLVRRRVSQHTVLASTLPSVSGDRVQLLQVLLNLILNSAEAMSAVAETARELVIQSSAQGSNEVLVQVRDRGVGLDPTNRDRIFAPFFTTKPNGMGMGLSISKSIIEAHGGKLWATPNVDGGATFHFTLPAG